MIRAYLAGARDAAQRWLLVIFLWLFVAALGVAFALASGAWLNEALEQSLATRTLFRQLDPDVFVDLWYHHREGLQMLLVLAAVLAVLNAILWWWLHAVLICHLQGTSDEPSEPWTRGLLLTPLMARLFVLALAILAMYSGAIGGAAYFLLRWTRSSPSALIWDEIAAAAGVAWILGYVFLVAVHDHARLRACRTGQGALSAYRWALGFVRGGGERAFPLACALQLTAVALWSAYQIAAVDLSTTAVLGLTGSLLWGETYIVVRVFMRVWFFAAQNEIQT